MQNISLDGYILSKKSIYKDFVLSTTKSEKFCFIYFHTRDTRLKVKMTKTVEDLVAEHKNTGTLFDLGYFSSECTPRTKFGRKFPITLPVEAKW